jgi:hypothetical protein
MQFEEVAKVEIEQRRWYIRISIYENGLDKPPTVYVASADRLFTEGSGIWFRTEEETEEWRARYG